jgi:uncharacterized protein (TIGR03437 family)
MPWSAERAGHPAQPGDEILIWGSGFGLSTAEWVNAGWVAIGGVKTQVLGVIPATDAAGASALKVRVPLLMEYGSAIPVWVEVVGADGQPHRSGAVQIAVDWLDR